MTLQNMKRTYCLFFQVGLKSVFPLWPFAYRSPIRGRRIRITLHLSAAYKCMSSLAVQCVVRISFMVEGCKIRWQITIHLDLNQSDISLSAGLLLIFLLRVKQIKLNSVSDAVKSYLELFQEISHFICIPYFTHIDFYKPYDILTSKNICYKILFLISKALMRLCDTREQIAHLYCPASKIQVHIFDVS